MKTLIERTALVLAALVLLPTLTSAEPAVFEKRGAAIRGYDPVAYFTTGAPTPGDRAITHEWNGATWRFASEENRELFVKDPLAYAPQFGGWCAYAMSLGRYASTDPKAWTIVDGRLYLNYSLSVRETWLADRDANITSAEGHWARLQAR